MTTNKSINFLQLINTLTGILCFTSFTSIILAYIMNSFYSAGIAALFTTIVWRLIKVNKKQSRAKTSQTRFKSLVSKPHRSKEKVMESISNSLMLNPDRNINLDDWNDDEELREKADIHRARLSRFGRSKLNGEMLFMEKMGGVYRFSSNGEKLYV